MLSATVTQIKPETLVSGNLTPDPAEEKLQELFALASKGWRLHPLRDNSKKPRLDEWQHKATCDEDTIAAWHEKWPDANVGVVMGEKSGIIDIECDGPEAEELFLELFAGHDIITPTFQSTRGKHHIFKWTAEMPCPDKAHFRIGEIDFKMGGGGKGSYCCFPPSVHESGKRYEWIVHPDDCDGPADLPDEVIARITIRLMEGAPQAGGQKNASGSNWRDKLNGAPQGERNDTAASVIGFRIKDVHNLDDHTEIIAAWEWAKGWNAQNKPPLPEAELRQTFDSILNREKAGRTGNDSFATMLDDPQWRLVKRLSDPAVWKLFSPHWEGYVSLDTKQLMTWPHFQIAVAEQKSFAVNSRHKKLWEGGFDRKAKREIPSKRDQLMGGVTTEAASPEENPLKRMAAELWDNYCASPLRVEKLDFVNAPGLLPDGDVYFRFQSLVRQMSHGQRDFKESVLIDLLNKIGCECKPKRVDGKQLRFKRLNRPALEKLEKLAMGGTLEESQHAQ